MDALVHSECATSQHPCFKDKMILWRTSGHSPFKMPHSDWASTTNAELEREIFADAKANGYELERAR